MSEIDNPKALFESTCPTNSESFALQNLGDMMAPEFSENCIIIVDPGMRIHNQAYAIIDYQGELYFRQFINVGKKPLIRCLNNAYKDIELIDDYDVKGCVVQQKQRKQTALHYYHLDEVSKKMVFSEKGRAKN
ncbi:MAG: S24 family peptidase [Gammaproteobacteria bacterium]|nr:S24 family peptidase [Gammaproteobacteria bacterium]